MALLQIPSIPEGQARWQQRTTLQGRDFLLTFEWSQRDGHWYLSMADVDGTPIFTGRKLVDRWPLLRYVLDAKRPPGEVFVADTLEQGKDPDFTDLGTRCVLIYEEA